MRSITMMATAFMLLLLLLPCISAFSIPSMSSNLRTLLSTLDEDSQAQFLKLLKHHSIEEICNYQVQPSPSNSTTLSTTPFPNTDTHTYTPLSLLHTIPTIFSTLSMFEVDWRTGVSQLHALHSCPAALTYATTFRLHIFLWEQKNNPPPPSLPALLISTLSHMPSLHKLALTIPEHHTEPFAAAFSASNLTLPTVTTLVVSAHVDFLVRHCPNISTLSSNGWTFLHVHKFGYGARNHTLDLIRAAGTAPQLTRLEINEWWSVDLVESVLDHVPEIQYLALNGGVYNDGIATLLPNLAKFKKLDTLALADAHALGVGFDPPGCGNVYLGPGGEEYLKQVQDEGWVATKRVGEMVREGVQGLRVLWVGEWARGEMVRADTGEGGGEVGVRWDADVGRDAVIDFHGALL